MALQVWLPLNGDLKQNGVSSTIIDANGVEINTNGKIGKCVEFNGSITSYIYSNNLNTNLWTECSITLWLKIVSFNAAWDTYLQIGDGNTPWNSYIVGLLRNNTNSNLVFCISNGTTSTQASFTTPNLETGIWYHIACVYKPGHCLIYINGNLHADNTTTIAPNFSSSTKLFMGGLPSAYKSKSCMNDLRIYDHALSIKEIKDISKALVCHYPLDNNGSGMPNLAKGTNTASTGTNVFGYGEQTGGSSRTIEYDGGIPCAKITRNTTAHSGWAYLYYNNLDYSLIKTSTTYTVSFDIIASGSGTISFSGFQMGNGTNNMSASTTVVQNAFNSTSWSHIVFKTITKASFDDLTLSGQLVYMNTSFLQTTETWMMMKNMKVEEGTRDTSWCPHTSDASYSIFNINGTTEFDTSGYKNNGTKSGTITYDSNTPRYSISTVFDGTSSGIEIQSSVFSVVLSGSFTVSMWVYNNDPSDRSILFGNWNLTGAFFNIEKTTGDKVRFYWNGNPDTYFNNSVLNTYTWIHLAITRTENTVKCYINGVLKDTSTTTLSGTVPSNATIFRLGRDGRSDTTMFKGRMSDFRLYARALSESDILELYNKPINFNKHSIMAQGEFIEK